MSDGLRGEDWIGRETQLTDRIDANPVRALTATLDRDEPAACDSDALPPLWHRLFFLPHDRQSALGADGHVHRVGFLPPVALPRRMWAGGRFEFVRPLRIGEALSRTSRIAGISSRSGRSGPLVFVRVEHAINNIAGLALREEHDIVYRAPPAPDAAPPTAARRSPRDEQFTLCGRIDERGAAPSLWARNADGELAMQADAVLAA